MGHGPGQLALQGSPLAAHPWFPALYLPSDTVIVTLATCQLCLTVCPQTHTFGDTRLSPPAWGSVGSRASQRAAAAVTGAVMTPQLPATTQQATLALQVCKGPGGFAEDSPNFRSFSDGSSCGRVRDLTVPDRQP